MWVKLYLNLWKHSIAKGEGNSSKCRENTKHFVRVVANNFVRRIAMVTVIDCNQMTTFVIC